MQNKVIPVWHTFLFDNETIPLKLSINLSLRGLKRDSMNEIVHGRYDEDYEIWFTLSRNLSKFWEHPADKFVVHLRVLV